MACEYCTEAIALEQPCMELLCRHKVHTECALREAATHEILNVRCPSCREFFVPRQMIDEVEAVHGDEGQAEVIQYMWEHEPRFKADLESIRETRMAVRKATTAVTKKEKELHKKLDEEVEPFIAQIKTRVKAAKEAFKALPEQKEAAKLSKIYFTKLAQFSRRWGTGTWRIRNALRHVAAARVLVGGAFDHGGIFYRARHLREFNVRIG